MSHRWLCVALPLLTCAAAAGAQAANPIQQASVLIGTGKPAEAIPILDSITTASPQLPGAWGLLGAALLSTRHLDRAVVALRKGIALPGVRPPQFYNLGLTFGLLGQMDSAFAWLHAARATGRVDMTALGTDPDAGPVRADPRYVTLVPTANEFASPFVEPVKILHEWDGDSAGDQFGWIARDIGDVDHDRRHDVITSAPSALGGAGVVYALSGGKGTRLWTVHGSGQDGLGTSVDAAGDVNHDGTPDVIAGAPGGNYALILSGHDGSLIRRLTGRSPTERFGAAVSDLGDVDHDGYGDVLVGAPGNTSNGAGAGRVYLISGRTGDDLHVWNGEAANVALGSTVGGMIRGTQLTIVAGAPGTPGGGRALVWRALVDRPAFTIDADSTGARLGGMFVSVLGDVDGDGVLDVYASDWPNAAKGPGTGRIYVHSGATGKRLFTLTGDTPGYGFGIGVADAGDINRDGRADLIIGQWQFAGAAPSGGKVYLYSGRDAHLLGTLTGKVMGETLGFDATGIGDIDGDGTPDLLLTSAWSGIHGTRSGRLFIVSGAELLHGAKP